ncbi:MAG: Dam family site-specific DNA-(adenine-N6)-methyltransferase [Succinivibrionaceae bacterium]|nr:Dam family site-specific DNA-(adenine-N6)-methyltransferase [Succinivibrionaceae bacterium]
MENNGAAAARPLVKWAGGKRQLLRELLPSMPRRFGRYFEPFVGGGAVFFALGRPGAFINDSNPELINLYRQLKERPQRLIAEAEALSGLYNQSAPAQRERLYYDLRDEFNAAISAGRRTVRSAALLLALNRAGFNGLYRVNSRGEFNTPWGHREQIRALEAGNALRASRQLEGATITCGDFADCLGAAAEGDLVFFDSPYYETFGSYRAGGFAEADHERLAALFDELTGRGVRCVLTNSNTEFIRGLYARHRIREVAVRHCINRDGTHRAATEIIVRNFR